MTLVLLSAMMEPVLSSCADAVADFDRARFREQLGQLAVDEPPCATATVVADEVVLPTTWSLSLGEPGVAPERYIRQHVRDLSWIPVIQPREITALLVGSRLVPDPRRGRNIDHLRWLADSEWWLANEFYWPEGRSTEHQTLVLQGLTGATGVWLNGQAVEMVETGFTELRSDLTGLWLAASRNRLVLRISGSAGQKISPPSWPGSPLPRCGLEGGARIVAEPDVEIKAVGSHVVLASDCTSGTVELDIRVRKRSPGTTMVYAYAILRLPDEPRRLPLYHSWGEPESLNQGENRLRLTLREQNIRLWWPIGTGESYVYPLQVQIRQGPATVLAERRMLIGFRSIEWREDSVLVVNGRSVPIKATEWTSIDPFHPDPQKALIESVQAVIQTNLNAVWVRSPGGFESDQFYDMCDQAGLLVLQEVPTDSSRLDWYRVMNLERHPSAAAWTLYAVRKGKPAGGGGPLKGLDHRLPVLPVSPDGKVPGLRLLNVPAAPHPRTWEELLEATDRWPPPPSWQPDKEAASQLAAQIPRWGTVENWVDYSLLTHSIQAASLQAAIEQTRVTSPASGGLITGQLRALWPCLTSALFDVLNRPSMGFWAVRRSWEPAILSLRRIEERFEAWIANDSAEPVSGDLSVFDALRPERGRWSAAPVVVPPGTAVLVWSSTEESWAEEAFRGGDLRILGAFLGEPLSAARLTRAALPVLRTADGTPIPGPASLEDQRDPRLPPDLQASLFCVAPAQVGLPTADLHIITFGEDHGPWRVTIRSFGRKYLRQVQLLFDPPGVARASDQFFDIVPDSGRLVVIDSLDPRQKEIPVIVTAANAAPVSFVLLRK